MPSRRSALLFFHPLTVSPISRASYQREFVSVAFVSVVVACISGGVMAVIAKKAYGAGDLVITLLAGSEAISNISSLFWTRLLHGRDRVKATVILQCCTLACALTIAAAPFNNAGVGMILVGTVLARTFLTGIISARADLWRANYPRHDRGRITGKLTILATLIAGVFALIIAAAMDLPGTGGHAFRPIYVLAALAALIGVRSFSRVRWRGRVAHLKDERAHPHAGGAIEDQRGARAMLAVLKRDKDYRRFMVAQFVLGAPNIAITPIFVIALQDRFSLGYTQSILLTGVIETLAPILAIPMWARLLDRMHIIRFRAYHSWTFVLANFLMAGAFLVGSVPMLYVSKVILGVAFGGGMLAWNLGHHDFARRGLATLYMGVHVTLTGVRGVFAPFVGLLLYAQWSITIGNTHIAWPGLGDWTFMLLSAVTVVGSLMFVRLYLDTRVRTRASPVRD